MPVVIKGEVKGLKGLEKSLLALAKTYGNPKYALQAIRPAIRKALMPIFELIKRTTPVDTGRLRDSTKLAIRRPKAIEKKNPGIGKECSTNRTCWLVLEIRQSYRKARSSCGIWYKPTTS